MSFGCPLDRRPHVVLQECRGEVGGEGETADHGSNTEMLHPSISTIPLVLSLHQQTNKITGTLGTKQKQFDFILGIMSSD